MIDVWALKLGEDDERLYLVFNETYVFISFPTSFQVDGDPFLCTYHWHISRRLGILNFDEWQVTFCSVSRVMGSLLFEARLYKTDVQLNNGALMFDKTT